MTTYVPDALSRLGNLIHNASGTSHDTTFTFTYNPSSQIASRTRTNSVFDWSQPASFNDSYTANGLNQYTNVDGVAPTYDTRGNLTNDGAKTYGYDYDNRMISASGGVGLTYDPAGRLHEAGISTAATRFLYDGADIIAEYTTSGGLLRRFVHGPGVDEPLLWYEGTGTSDKRYLIADERGSVIGITNGSGTVTTVNKYDAYGVPAAGNSGRFQYTGQIWLADVGLYHYKARAYDPDTGRFLQTDPIGVAGGINLYAYVGSDPVNLRDPLGLQDGPIPGTQEQCYQDRQVPLPNVTCPGAGVHFPSPADPAAASGGGQPRRWGARPGDGSAGLSRSGEVGVEEATPDIIQDPNGRLVQLGTGVTLFVRPTPSPTLHPLAQGVRTALNPPKPTAPQPLRPPSSPTPEQYLQQIQRPYEDLVPSTRVPSKDVIEAPDTFWRNLGEFLEQLRDLLHTPPPLAAPVCPFPEECFA